MPERQLTNRNKRGIVTRSNSLRGISRKWWMKAYGRDSGTAQNEKKKAAAVIFEPINLSDLPTVSQESAV